VTGFFVETDADVVVLTGYAKFFRNDVGFSS